MDRTLWLITVVSPRHLACIATVKTTFIIYKTGML